MNQSDAVPASPQVAKSHESSTETWLATIVATFVVKYAGDNSLYVPVVKLVEIFFLGGYLNTIISLVSINILYLLIFLGAVGYAYKSNFYEKNKNNLNVFNRLFYNQISLSKNQHKKKILWYFDNHKKFVTTTFNLMISKPEFEFAELLAESENFCSMNVLSHDMKPEYGKKIYFKDSEHKVSGFFVWNFEGFAYTKKYGGSNKTEPTTVERTCHIEHVTLFVSKFCKHDAKYYFDKITEEYTNYVEEETMKKLSYVYLDIDNNRNQDGQKRCRIDTQSVVYFDSTKNKNSANIFDSYFHNDKKQLMKLIDSIKPEYFNRSDKFQRVPQLGMILHGPPGTGKSDMVRRMGIYLKRHVVVLDMLKIPKSRLIALLRNPWDDNEDLTTEKFIFYLDEFDAMIVELKRRETLVKKLEMDKETTFSHGPSDKLMELLKKDKNAEIDDKVSEYANFITYSELLGILQGLIPLEQIIFVATTNNLDTIKELCSKNNNVGEEKKDSVVRKSMYAEENNDCALIRHGRLTPFLCDYFNGKTIKEICKFYFDKVPEISDDAKPNIINTQIMHWVENYYDEPDGYELFLQEITKHMGK